MLVPSGARAQRADDRYDALVRQYARGDQQDAAVELARWSRADVSAAGARAARFAPDAQRAAVMLHTDAGIALLSASATNLGVLHLLTASHIVGAMRDRRGDHLFERRWLSFVATVYTANGLLGSADRTIRDALSWYSREPLLYVARGALGEMRIAMTFVDLRSGNQIARRDRAYDAAAADYRRAIGLDDRLAIAHLRLGSVHFTTHDGRARENFDAALERATEVRDRYLAELFLGALAERGDRLDEAERAYTAAQALAPGCQTPYVALARIDHALGRAARAGEAAAAFTAIPEKSNDPWWDFHLGGFDQVSLAWLHAQAQAP